MNKPPKIGLLATKQEIITLATFQQNYELKVIQSLLNEYQVNTIQSLVICLAEKFHPDFLSKHKRGAKLKWSEYLNALLAFEVDREKCRTSLRKTAILKVLEEPQWSQLARNSKDKFELFSKADKHGRNSKIYPCIEKHYKYLEITNQLDEWEDIVKSTIYSALKI